MRAWFLQGEANRESDALCCLLHQWAKRPENNHWKIECLRGTPDGTALGQDSQPDVVLLAESSCPGGPWLNGLLDQGVGLIVAASPERADPYRLLAERYAVQLMALPATSDELAWALLNLVTSLERQRGWQARINQLQQRLNDRILVERAKGILVERLSISEKEAYQRLRLQSRRQRRPIRDIAQCLLDTQLLFSPTKNGFVALPDRNGQAVVEESNEEACTRERENTP